MSNTEIAPSLNPPLPLRPSDRVRFRGPKGDLGTVVEMEGRLFVIWDEPGQDASGEPLPFDRDEVGPDGHLMDLLDAEGRKGWAWCDPFRRPPAIEEQARRAIDRYQTSLLDYQERGAARGARDDHG